MNGRTHRVRPPGWQWGTILIAVLLLTNRTSAQGQSSQSSQSTQLSPFTVGAAVEYALAHYPAVRAALERQMAARAEISVTRTNYLPRADLLWQGNRATHNNFFGLLLPQSVVPTLSGPALSTTSNSSAWDSSAGVMMSWEAFDFGYRGALVSVARAEQQVATAGVALTRLDVAAATASAFFNLLATQQSVRAAQADVVRREVFANTVHVLVNNQLRPGADASRADAELAAARIRLIQAQTAERVASYQFADLLGVVPAAVSIDSSSLLQIPPNPAMPSAAMESHPTALAQNAQTQLDSAQVHVLERSYAPRFYFQSSVSGRSSGVNLDGSVQEGLNGLNLNRENWAVGLTVTFPALDIFAIRARKQMTSAQLRAQQAVYEQTIQDLTSLVEQARVAAEGAREVAANTPIELHAASDTETQARARYESGLTSIVEVAEAQGLLAQAEITDAIAKLNAWSGLASLAAARGDLQPFLQLLQAAGGQ
jgi:outer membrane protein